MTASEWFMLSRKVQAVLTDAEGTAVILKPGWKPAAIFAKHPRDIFLPLSEAVPTGSCVGFTATAPCTKPTTITPRRFAGTVIAEDGDFVKFEAHKQTVKSRWYKRTELSDFTPPPP